MCKPTLLYNEKQEIRETVKDPLAPRIILPLVVINLL